MRSHVQNRPGAIVIVVCAVVVLLSCRYGNTHQTSCSALQCFPCGAKPLPRLRRMSVVGLNAAQQPDTSSEEGGGTDGKVDMKSVRSLNTLLRRAINLVLSGNGLAILPIFFVLGSISQFLFGNGDNVAGTV
mmetsp:Transcript_161526/g.518618  ORF Transcript_161526/g.518618 Transcript_161526/m.518618 type:complete len:132 (-) Transcript_161526:301-696(-)